MPLPPMMILGAAKMGSSILGGITGSRTSKDAAKRAEEIGALNYEELMRRSQTEQDLGNQEILNLMETQARRKGTVEGMYAKSGLLMTGTPATAMQEMEQAQQFNVEQAQESVNERVQRLQFEAKMALMQAEGKAAGLEEQAKGDIFSGIFGAASGGLNMLSAWGGMSDTVKPGGIPSRKDPMYNLNLLSGWNK